MSIESERFCELLERVGDLTEEEDRELHTLSCELDALDWVDDKIRAGFRELDERLGTMETLH